MLRHLILSRISLYCLSPIMKQFWIFGYGSLMWRPGFAFRHRESALINGYHRRF